MFLEGMVFTRHPDGSMGTYSQDAAQKSLVLAKPTPRVAEVLGLSGAVAHSPNFVPDPNFTVPGVTDTKKVHLEWWQRKAVSFAVYHRGRGVFFGDVIGSGKSAEVLATLQALDAFPVLIVTVNRMKQTFGCEVEKWLPLRAYYVLNGTNAELPRADIYIANYELLSIGVRVERVWHGKYNNVILGPLAQRLSKMGLRAIVLDEMQACKSFKAARTRAVKKLVKDIEIRLAFSGTSIRNRPYEIIPQLQILGRFNELFGSYDHFVERYCGGKWNYWANGWDTQGASNLEELNQILRRSTYIREDDAKILAELPAIRRKGIDVEITTRQDYDAIVAGLSGYKPDGSKSSLFSMAQALQETAGLGKIAETIRIVNEALAKGRKVLVFAYHIAVQQALVKAFPGCGSLLGETEDKEAERHIRRFQTDPNCKVFVASLKAAHLGLTLTAASVVVMVEFDWVPAENDQAEGRSYRKGQTQEVDVFYLVGKDTIDEEMFKVLSAKRDVVDMVNTGNIHEDVMRYELKKLGRFELFEMLQEKAKRKSKRRSRQDYYEE